MTRFAASARSCLLLLAVVGGCRCEEWLATKRQGPQPPEPAAVRTTRDETPAQPPPVAPRPAPRPIPPAPAPPPLTSAPMPMTMAPPPPPPPPPADPVRDEETVGDEAPRPLQPLRSNLLHALPNLRASPSAIKNSNLRFRGLRPAMMPPPANEN